MFPRAATQMPCDNEGMGVSQLARSGTDRMAGGVCGGIAMNLGMEPVIVRTAFVALTAAWISVPLYLLAWAFLPARRNEAEPEVLQAPLDNRRVLGLGLIVVGIVLLARQLRITAPDEVLWPFLCAAAGFGFIARQARPMAWVGTAGALRSALRVALGVIVVAGGVVTLIAANLSPAVVVDGALPAALVAGGLALILGPWIAVLARDRWQERWLRVRADERAEVAAHLHDSVLQTLALIQRTDDPSRVAALARRQERELRDWLYAEESNSSERTLRTAIEQAAAEVEDLHGVRIDVVSVGDAVLDVPLESLLAAIGEAMTNAAQWSGRNQLSLFVEVGEEVVEAFVRDTGLGFDPAAVGDHRLGIRESIVGRMRRAGGECEIRSTPGEGTEVYLRLVRH